LAAVAYCQAASQSATKKTDTYDTTFKVDKTLGATCPAFDPKSTDYSAFGVPKNVPILVHDVKWNADDTYAEQWLSVDAEQKDFTNKRFFGRKEIYVLAIHDNVLTLADITYKTSAKKKAPQFITDLESLLFGLTAKLALPARSCRYGLLDMQNVPTPSDITVTATFTAPSPLPSPSPKPAPAPPANGEIPEANVADAVAATNTSPASKTVNFTGKFDNEGKYWAAFSVGLPVTSNKLTNYQTTGGILLPTSASRENAYGFLDLFPGPQDTKSTTFTRTPHLLVGLPLAGQPLDHPAAGAGMGTSFYGITIEGFAGVVFNRTTVPAAATGTATDARWVRKLIFGFNIPLSQYMTSFGKKKS
jgi:hypothetical protein